MSKKKVYNKGLYDRKNRLREGSRVVGMGAINRSGAGVHKSKKPHSDWRKDWGL